MIFDDDSYMAIIMIIDVIVVMVVIVNVSIQKNTIVLSIVFDNIEL